MHHLLSIPDEVFSLDAAVFHAQRASLEYHCCLAAHVVVELGLVRLVRALGLGALSREREDRGGDHFHKSERAILLLDYLARVLSLFELVPLLEELDLLLAQHLRASFVELIGLLEVFLGLLWRELVENVGLAGLLRNNPHIECLLHLNHVLHQALVAVFTIERVTPCSPQVVYRDLGTRICELVPEPLDEGLAEEQRPLLDVILFEHFVARHFDLGHEDF